MGKNKLYLKEWFNELNVRQKAEFRTLYTKEFSISKVTFYRQINSKDLSVQRTLFCAQYFNVKIEDLLEHPLKHKAASIKNEEKILSTEKNELGLVPA